MTPETDAKASDIIGFFSCATVPAEFARNLERERDEAIRQRDETNTSSKYACDYNYEQKLKAERERDEAREDLAAAKDRIKELEGQVSYARHERNKALNEIDEYKATFDVRWQAQMRAVTRWQEETKQEVMWPGHEDLCLWLIRKLEATK